MSSYLIRLAMAGVGLSYFHTAGTVRPTLPLSYAAVLGSIALYALLNAAMLLRRLLRPAAAMPAAAVIGLDLAMLLVIVLQDPYPASPVGILLLSASVDHGLRFRPAEFTVATLAALLLLAGNILARIHSPFVLLSPDGLWLNLVIGALMINFLYSSLGTHAARAERRRIAGELAAAAAREQRGIEEELVLARFGEVLRGVALDRDDFAARALTSLVNEIGGKAAVLYELSEDADGSLYLQPLSAYAAALRRIRGTRIALDQGPVGACALRRRPIILDDVPAGYFDLVSGLGRCPPKHLYVMPLVFGTRTAGVVELALTQPLPPSRLRLLQRMNEALAATLLLIHPHVAALSPAAAPATSAS